MRPTRSKALKYAAAGNQPLLPVCRAVRRREWTRGSPPLASRPVPLTRVAYRGRLFSPTRRRHRCVLGAGPGAQLASIFWANMAAANGTAAAAVIRLVIGIPRGSVLRRLGPGTISEFKTNLRGCPQNSDG